MKLVIVNNKLAGEKLANPIYTENGVMFLNKGYVLTDSGIKRLINMGINTVYIEDDNDEIQLKETIETSIKLKLLKTTKQLLEEIKIKNMVNDEKVTFIIKEIITNINLSENAVLINNLVPNDDISKLAVHSLNVAILAIMVGTNKKYDGSKLLKLGSAALLHDIGKLFTNEKEHVRIGHDLIKKNISFSPMVYVSVYQIYERIDGNGLFKIAGTNIYEFAKIIGICNEYINCISGTDRILPHEAIEKITAESVVKFDKDILKDFLKSIYCYPNGLPVILNNGLSAIVVMQNKNANTRPIVAVKTNEGYKFINLIEILTLFVEKVLL